jgi:hypothetical protein
VRDASGAPLADAVVRPWAAAPGHGVGTRCRTCWPDCGKHATTDATGRYALSGLDDSLHFVVVASAPGYVPKQVHDVWPTRGPVDVRLVPLPGLEVPAERVVSGRVLDAADRPIEGALVRLIGWHHDSGGALTAPADDATSAVSDATGFFMIAIGDTSATAYEHLGLRRGAVDGTTRWLMIVEAHDRSPVLLQTAPGGQGTVIHLPHGATLRGRVTKDGRGLQGIEVTAFRTAPHDALDPWGTSFLRDAVGHFPPAEVATDARGEFALTHLPPRTDYVVFAPMESTAPLGSAPLLRIVTADEDSTGPPVELATRPARRLTGRLVHADGTPPPAGTALLLARAATGLPGSFDLAAAGTDSLGRFSWGPLPADSVDVSLYFVPGWHLAGAVRRLPSMQTAVRIADRGDVELELRLERDSR